AAADEPSAGTVFARPGTVVSQPNGDADQHLRLAAGFRTIVDLAAADAGTPVAPGRDFEPEPRAQPVEVRRRHHAYLGLQLLPVAVWGRVFVRQHCGESAHVRAHARGAIADAAAGLCAHHHAELELG